jgi:uncharacterized protein YndB with AHSA1/START domain
VKKIEVSKIFNAPVELVWQVWADPELVQRWWGPKNFTSPSANIDFRIGGKSIVSMQAPKELGGQIYFSLWLYQKIEHFKSIEFIQSLCDELGNKINPESVGMPADFPLNIKTVVTFNKLSDTQTKMTVTEYANFGTISNFAQIGLEQSIDKMNEIFQS